MNEELKELQNVLFSMLVDFKKVSIKNDFRFFLVGGSALGAVRHQGFIPWDDDIDIGMMRKDFEKMEQILKKQGNKVGMYYYSPVEQHMVPDAPLGFLYHMVDVNGKKIVKGKIDIHPIDNVPISKNSQKIQKFCSIAYFFAVYQKPVKNKGIRIRKLSIFLLKVTPSFMFIVYKKIFKKIITKWNNSNSCNVCSLFGVAGYEREVMPRTYIEPLQIKKFETASFYVPADTHQYLQQLYGDYMKLPPIEEQKPQIHYNGYRAQEE